MLASGVVWYVIVYGANGCTHSIRLQFGSGSLYSVRYMFISDMMLWAILGRSVFASVGRALCFRFVRGDVVVLLLL